MCIVGVLALHIISTLWSSRTFIFNDLVYSILEPLQLQISNFGIKNLQLSTS